ncbi:MAG: gamma-glutamylcyclotransferase [Alphaproteobacteria bacterium]|nr:gamma-glutamylcyclotransferase [Alphaproteobacteria bacterium]
MSDDVWLFSCGTLQQEGVQLATFGRLLEGRIDALPGYTTVPFEIMDPQVIATSGKRFHTMARPSGDLAEEVSGVVFRITPAELAAADTYEVSDYKRILVRLKSGLETFVYVGV